MRLIDADDIVYDSIDSEDTNRHAYYYGTGIMAARKEDIDAMPTIELPERKKGKWLVDEDGNMECPFCGNTCGFGNYCNECGADLRGERNEID